MLQIQTHMQVPLDGESLIHWRQISSVSLLLCLQQCMVENILSTWWHKRKSQGISKIIRMQPLGTVNVSWKTNPTIPAVDRPTNMALPGAM